MATYDLGTATGISDNDDIASAIKGVHDSGLSSGEISTSLEGVGKAVKAGLDSDEISSALQANASAAVVVDTERVVLSEQLIDTTDMVYQSIFYHTDTISTVDNPQSTNYIKVTPGKTYYFRHPSSNRYGIIGFTGKDDATSIGRISESNFQNYTLVIPDNVNYVKIGLTGYGEEYSTDKYDQFSLSEGDYLDESNMEFEGVYANESINSLPFGLEQVTLNGVLDTQIASENLLDYDSILYDVAIHATSEVLYTASGSSVSPLIPCSANDVFTFAGITDYAARRVLFYDESLAPIDMISIAASTGYSLFAGDYVADSHYYTITVPDNSDIVYMRAQCHSSDTSYTDMKTAYRLYKGTEYKPYSEYRETQELAGNELNPSEDVITDVIHRDSKRYVDFSDKTIAFFGDSITSNNRWVTAFNAIIRPKQYYNYAAGGATLSQPNGVVDLADLQNTGCEQALQFVTDYASSTVDEPDYIIIALGTNDFNLDPVSYVDEDSIDDSFTNGGNTLVDLSTVDLTLISGALRYIVQTLGEVFENTKFFICTPIPNVNNSYSDQKAVCNNIRWTAQRMSIPIIEQFHSSNILTLWDYPAGVSTYRNLVDGVHPFGDDVTETPAVNLMAEHAAAEFLNYTVKPYYVYSE